MPINMPTADFWIEKLDLLPHPEGGFYRQTYKSDMIVAGGTLTGRAASTAIYFLLRSQDISHLHRIDADEMWHFYAGSPLSVHEFDEAGTHKVHSLGLNLDAGQSPQALVPAGRWFGACLDTPDSYSLVGCTVAPGFEFSGFEMAERGTMLGKLSQHSAIVRRLTPDP